MINFILYEDNKKMRDNYKKIILKLVGSRNQNYKIEEIDSYTDTTEKILDMIDGNKIYILDIEVPGKSGLDLARSIRRKDDWSSQIIVVTSHEQYSNIGYTSKLLMLDFISKFSDLEKHLKEALMIAMDILSKQKALSFSLNGEIYQISYNNILYIEKDLNHNHCAVVTRDKEYLIRDTIQNLEKKLCDDHRFMKTHRSCIINLNQITSVDLNHNMIHFGDKTINLIARNKKKELKNRL